MISFRAFRGLSTHVAAWVVGCIVREASKIAEAKRMVLVEQVRGGLSALGFPSHSEARVRRVTSL